MRIWSILIRLIRVVKIIIIIWGQGTPTRRVSVLVQVRWIVGAGICQKVTVQVAVAISLI